MRQEYKIVGDDIVYEPFITTVEEPTFQGPYSKARCTPEQFKALPEYSTSYPTGVYANKQWKTQQAVSENGKLKWLPKWWLREYRLYPKDHPRHKTHMQNLQWELIVSVRADSSITG